MGEDERLIVEESSKGIVCPKCGKSNILHITNEIENPIEHHSLNSLCSSCLHHFHINWRCPLCKRTDMVYSIKSRPKEIRTTGVILCCNRCSLEFIDTDSDDNICCCCLEKIDRNSKDNKLIISETFNVVSLSHNKCWEKHQISQKDEIKFFRKRELNL